MQQQEAMNAILGADLSLEALGLMVYVISLEDADFSPQSVMYHWGMGSSKTYRIFNELLEGNYLTRETIRTNWRVKRVRYAVNYDMLTERGLGFLHVNCRCKIPA